MKLKVDRKTLAQAIGEVTPFTSAKPTIDILKYAKITTKGSVIKIEANDVHKAMIKYIDMMECDGDGEFLFEIAEVNKFLPKIKDAEIEISADATGMTIKHGKGEASFATADAAEYPSFKPADNADVSTIDIPAKTLCDFVKTGKGFVTTETLRPQLTAIYAYIKNGVFGFCATDTHRLVTDHTDVMFDVALDINWYIDPTIFGSLLKTCAAIEGDITVKVCNKNVSYKMGNTIIHTTQIQGKFPNFERVIPQQWNIECACDKGDILDSVSRSAMFCAASNCIKLDISRMDITVSVDNLEFMRKSTETVSHNGCDGEIKIGMSADNLQQCLNACDDGEVLIRMTDASCPALFIQNGTPNRTILTMPMILAN